MGAHGQTTRGQFIKRKTIGDHAARRVFVDVIILIIRAGVIPEIPPVVPAVIIAGNFIGDLLRSGWDVRTLARAYAADARKQAKDGDEGGDFHIVSYTSYFNDSRAESGINIFLKRNHRQHVVQQN